MALRGQSVKHIINWLVIVAAIIGSVLFVQGHGSNLDFSSKEFIKFMKDHTHDFCFQVTTGPWSGGYCVKQQL